MDTDLITNLSGASFHEGALDRIRRGMIILGGTLSALTWMFFGWRMAAGLACGCCVA
jgi:hypothetical protein